VAALKDNSFQAIPVTAEQHFVLHLFAAIWQTMQHLHHLGRRTGVSLDDVFQDYPFLGDYFAEMRSFMPENLAWEDASRWWRTEITSWESASTTHLPLRAIAAELQLPFSLRVALILIGLVEEDSRFGTLYGDLQRPLAARRPALELIGRLVMDPGEPALSEPWSIVRPLLRGGLVQVVDQQAARSEWLLQVPPPLWEAVRNADAVPAWEGLRYQRSDELPRFEDLVYPRGFVEQLERLPTVLGQGGSRVLVLRGDPGSDPLEVTGAVARRMGRGLFEVPLSGLDADQRQQLGPLASLWNALPVLRCEPDPGETVFLPQVTAYDGPICLVLGQAGGLDSKLVSETITLTLPVPDPPLRARRWKQALGDRPCEDLATISDRFRLSHGFISQVARVAAAYASLDGRHAVSVTDVQTACRSLNRQLLDALADPLPGTGCWDDLVVTASTENKLAELQRRCRFREQLLPTLGPAFAENCTCGVRALFTGPSGTGKTLATRILAAALGMDLYRVDLAAVVNKYIGETEKNLHRILSRAEALDVILLLDEGDALLGRRTEVRSANDRYANLETNYLLQRLEHYQGIVIVTSNLGDNIDPAFQRRMDIVVPFFSPQAQERLQIFRRHLPETNAIDPAYLHRVATRCSLNGGQIRNAVLHASVLALEQPSMVCDEHVEQALRSEYRKAGATFALDRSTNDGNGHGGLANFVSALQEDKR
jgi:hypothetical protein